MHCTQCGAEAQGKFCASCGASLRTQTCRSCGEAVPAGTRFCTSCGTPAGGAGLAAAAGAHGASSEGSRGRDAGWWVAGGLLLLVLVWVGVGSLRDDPPAAGTVAAPVGTTGTGVAPAPVPGGGAPPDLSTMTARDAADRLFNRVMSAAAAGNTEEANSFLPMAMDAYELARPLNPDGLFHLALLQRAAGEVDASRTTAVEGLDANPDHLLNLSAAAEASLALGDAAAGTEYYQRMLDAWDAEIAAGRVEYEEHAPLLPLIREDAEALLDGSN